MIEKMNNTKGKKRKRKTPLFLIFNDLLLGTESIVNHFQRYMRIYGLIEQECTKEDISLYINALKRLSKTNIGQEVFEQSIKEELIDLQERLDKMTFH